MNLVTSPRFGKQASPMRGAVPAIVGAARRQCSPADADGVPAAIEQADRLVPSEWEHARSSLDSSRSAERPAAGTAATARCRRLAAGLRLAVHACHRLDLPDVAVARRRRLRAVRRSRCLRTVATTFNIAASFGGRGLVPPRREPMDRCRWRIVPPRVDTAIDTSSRSAPAHPASGRTRGTPRGIGRHHPVNR